MKSSDLRAVIARWREQADYYANRRGPDQEQAVYFATRTGTFNECADELEAALSLAGGIVQQTTEEDLTRSVSPDVHPSDVHAAEKEKASSDLLWCPSCGHRHQGRALGFICIGCACEKQPPFRRLAL